MPIALAEFENIGEMPDKELSDLWDFFADTKGICQTKMDEIKLKRTELRDREIASLQERLDALKAEKRLGVMKAEKPHDT